MRDGRDVRTVRRALPPARRAEPLRRGRAAQPAVNSGAEAVENAVKIARAATGRPGVVVFGNSFHGRTLLTLAMTGKIDYKRGFGPLPEESTARPAHTRTAVSTSDDAIRGLEELFARDADPKSVACVVLEPVQGEGGFIDMPLDFPPRLQGLCDAYGILYVDDEVQAGVGRTGPVDENYDVEPDLLVSGKSIGGGLPLAGVTGKAEVMDAVDPGGLGGTFGGNPVACAAALAILDEVATNEFRARADEVGRRIRSALEAMAGRAQAVGEVRGLGAMCAIELVEDRETKRPAAALAKATTQAARQRGLVSSPAVCTATSYASSSRS